MTPSSRFVPVPAEAIRARLIAAGFQRDELYQTEEVWYRTHDKDPNYRVVVYTSVAAGRETARSCGADAIRVLAVKPQPNRWPLRFVWPIFKARVFRTAPRGLDATKRAEHVVDRMIERCREAYAACNADRAKKGAA